MIGEFEEDAVLAGTAHVPDAFGDRLRCHHHGLSGSALRRSCGPHGIGRREISDIGVERVLHGHVACGPAIGLVNDALGQLDSAHVLILQKVRVVRDIAEVRIGGLPGDRGRQLRRGINRHGKRFALRRGDVHELLPTLRLRVAQFGRRVERGAQCRERIREEVQTTLMRSRRIGARHTRGVAAASAACGTCSSSSSRASSSARAKGDVAIEAMIRLVREPQRKGIFQRASICVKRMRPFDRSITRL